MAGEPLNVWITRAEPGAQATAERVRARGHNAVVAPLLVLRPVEGAGVDLRGVAALAFTSANGVRAFAAVEARRDLRVFTVGQATAQAAKAAGFRTVLSADGDVEALAARIAARARELDGAVLHAGGVEQAGDLVGALSEAGIEARGAALYDSAHAELGRDFLKDIGALDVALLHSPKAARALARLLRKHPAPRLRALCLSPAVLKPLSRAKLAAKASAPIPIEAALLNLVGRA